jgi:hypothetical protein
VRSIEPFAVKQSAGSTCVSVKTGSGFTVTVAEVDALQPFALVTVTVYVVELAGETVMAAAETLLLHTLEVPPDAVNVWLCPAQMAADGGVILGVGKGLTVITVEAEDVQPFALVTVTV